MEIKLSHNSRIGAQLVMTGRGCIIGQSGSGKSFLVGIISEELTRLGLPYCIIDTEGEYTEFKDHFKAIAVGGGNQDFGLDGDLTNLFSRSIRQGVPIILDLSEETDKKAKVFKSLEEIYKLEDKLRIPYLVIIEEADKFVPQVNHHKTNIIEELSIRGRKRGVGLIVATQRPSNISKNVLSQCSYGFIGKLTIASDLKAIKQLFSDKNKLSEVVNFGMGEFIPFGIGSQERFKVRTTYATQKGSTPIVGTHTAKGARPELDELIGRLKQRNNMKKPNMNGKKKITALSLKFSTNDAHVFARSIATRRFGIFGRPLEQPESIRIIYIMANLCKIRVPTKRKGEFEEYTFLTNRDFRLIRLTKGVKFEDNKIGRPRMLDPSDLSLLSQLRSRKKMPLANISKLSLGDAKDTNGSIKRLVKLKLITKDAKNVYAQNYESFLMGELPQLEETYAPGRELDLHRTSKEEIRAYSSSLYPNSSLVDFSTVYIPIYEIILRHKNKVRMFNIDGLYGKEVVGM